MHPQRASLAIKRPELVDNELKSSIFSRNNHRRRLYNLFCYFRAFVSGLIIERERLGSIKIISFFIHNFQLKHFQPVMREKNLQSTIYTQPKCSMDNLWKLQSHRQVALLIQYKKNGVLPAIYPALIRLPVVKGGGVLDAKNR